MCWGAVKHRPLFACADRCVLARVSRFSGVGGLPTTDYRYLSRPVGRLTRCCRTIADGPERPNDLYRMAALV
jgi:hypothetical protein